MRDTDHSKRGPGRPKAPPPVAKATRGRPRFVPVAEQRTLVVNLLAAGETQDAIQKLLGISHPVFLSRFRVEIEDGRLRLRAALLAVLFEKALDGNAAMLRQALDITARPDVDEPYKLPEAKPEAPVEPKPAKIGKKEQQALDAANPDATTKMGALMAARAQGSKTVQ